MSKQTTARTGKGGRGITLTPALARAAAHDEGNRNMRRHGRKAWNEDDWNAAAETFERLMLKHAVPESASNPGSIYTDLAYGNEYRKAGRGWEARFSFRSPRYVGLGRELGPWEKLKRDDIDAVERMIKSGKIVLANRESNPSFIGPVNGRYWPGWVVSRLGGNVADWEADKHAWGGSQTVEEFNKRHRGNVPMYQVGGGASGRAMETVVLRHDLADVARREGLTVERANPDMSDRKSAARFKKDAAYIKRELTRGGVYKPYVDRNEDGSYHIDSWPLTARVVFDGLGDVTYRVYNSYDHTHTLEEGRTYTGNLTSKLITAFKRYQEAAYQHEKQKEDELSKRTPRQSNPVDVSATFIINRSLHPTASGDRAAYAITPALVMDRVVNVHGLYQSQEEAEQAVMETVDCAMRDYDGTVSVGFVVNDLVTGNGSGTGRAA